MLLLDIIVPKSLRDPPLLFAVGFIARMLSFTSIICIFLTAIFFTEWKKEPSNMILLNNILAISLQQIWYQLKVYVIALDEENVQLCIPLIGLAHYFSLATIFWQDAIGYMQYRRFVDVLKPQPENIVTKCVIFCWLIPVLLLPLPFVLNHSLKLNGNSICHMLNTLTCITFYHLVFAGLIVNIVFFTLILKSVFCYKVKSESSQKPKIGMQIKLVIVLFLLLDLHWIFNAINEVTSVALFDVIFSLMEAFQGFMLFLVFVVMNRHTVLLYKKCFKRLFRFY